MPQRDLLLPWRTALDNAAIALQNRGASRAAARQRTQPLFEQLGLAGFEEARPGQLSGGMRQRVSFLRTLMAEKDVLLLDEPFGALDSITRAQLQEWLRQAMYSVPRTVLLVTHDVDEALLLCQRVVVLSARPGRVVQVLAVGDRSPDREHRERQHDRSREQPVHRPFGAPVFARAFRHKYVLQEALPRSCRKRAASVDAEHRAYRCCPKRGA